jgi:hypothetical protein
MVFSSHRSLPSGTGVKRMADLILMRIDINLLPLYSIDTLIEIQRKLFNSITRTKLNTKFPSFISIRRTSIHV